MTVQYVLDKKEVKKELNRFAWRYTKWIGAGCFLVTLYEIFVLFVGKYLDARALETFDVFILSIAVLGLAIVIIRSCVYVKQSLNNIFPQAQQICECVLERNEKGFIIQNKTLNKTLEIEYSQIICVVSLKKHAFVRLVSGCYILVVNCPQIYNNFDVNFRDNNEKS